MKNWKNQFREFIKNRLPKFYEVIFIFCVLFFNAQLITAQVEDSKTIREEYSGKQSVDLTHAHGPLLVKKSPDDKVYVEATISAKAKDRGNLNVLLEHFEINGGGLGTRLEVATDMQIANWNSRNGITTIKFKNGDKVKGVKDLVLSATLLVPDLKALELKNKYGDINIDTEVSGDLTVNLFSGKLETNGLCNNLDLTIKYGKGYLPNAGEAKVTLFDSDVIIGELFSADFNSKYSEVEIDNIGGDLNIQTFDDKWKVGHIKGDFNFNDKYSEFEFETFNNAEGSMFDGEIVAKSGNALRLDNSKYSKYKIGELASLDSKIAFDDFVEIEKINSVQASDSKYTEYRIGSLKDVFDLHAFDDEVKIERIAADFNTIALDGKYTTMDFDIEEGGDFSVDVKMQYGKFDHPDFDVRIHKEINSKIEIEGQVGKEKGTDANRLTISGFENKVFWK